MRKAWLSWSTGKDSAWALDAVRRRREVDVVALLTTLNRTHSRVAMHAVREDLLERQAEAAGLPLIKVFLPWPCPNQVYESAMAQALEQARADGVTHMIFGDLFLEDVRRYREEKLAGTGIQPLFPLWGLDTARLANSMIEAGVEARLTCVDPAKLGREFAGQLYNAALLASFPGGVDPCGENGEFHTFAFAGPMFKQPVECSRGVTIERDGFVFADLIPAGDAQGRACAIPPGHSRENANLQL
ncbi:MAG: adenine nucleotide alpha hydrolase [Acidobacteriota bacterium]|nr:adenine nucleotide alpha hydrolase [Acidobacteriota bacterium]